MHFGFSYVGLIFLVMLFVPNIIWAKHQPQGYDRYAKNENKILLALERAGEVLVTALVLIFSDFNVQGFGSRLIWLAAALILFIIFMIYVIRAYNFGNAMSRRMNIKKRRKRYHSDFDDIDF